MEAFLYLAVGLVVGAFLGRSHKPAISIEAQPLPCVLFRRDMPAAERVAWMRATADQLEAKQPQKESGDDAR